MRDDLNIHGPLSAAVPGTVAGLALAAERYGTMPLADLIQPAIRLAREGFPVSWHTSYEIAQDLALLNRYPSTRAIFTQDGRPWPVRPFEGAPPYRLVQRDLADTLEAIARGGADAFYRGEIAQAIDRGMRDLGGIITADDLASYEVRVSAGLAGDYRGHRVVTPQAPSGGPTLHESLRMMALADLRAMGHNTVETLHYLIEAFRQAFVDRFAYLADPAFVEVPVEALTSEAYAQEQAATFGTRARREVEPGDRARLGVTHHLARSMPAYGRPGDTTHLSVIDERRNAVSLTQTLLSLWGSRVVVPGTGILLNNGMMWFDPEPGRPNSIAPGKRPLANMCPTLVFDGDRVLMSVGAMGGRKIMNALAQIISNVVDHGMSIQPAITAPRVDCSVDVTAVSGRIDPAVVEGLRERGHRLQVVVEDLGGAPFASPCGVLVAPDGTLRGGANPYYPAMAIGY
ncbi:MAG: gamma-glutamyltransferase family protein [Thermomicrobiaceae bacterium]|nr:gamma-glutamyltransferase family protein [Thermomicrobiaceae bacterium]